MVAGDVEVLHLEMRDRLNKYQNLKLLWRRECLILVNISMFRNQCKNLLEETCLQSFWKISALLVRLAQTISPKY